MERRIYSLCGASNYVPQRDWSMGELARAKERLQIGAKVEVVTGEGIGHGLFGKRFKATVTSKHEKHFIVRVKAKHGEWNESFSYIDLMKEKKVKVLKR